jgi:hypothetical protein
MPADPGPARTGRPIADRMVRVPRGDQHPGRPARIPGDEAGGGDGIDPGPPDPVESLPALERSSPSRALGGGPIDAIGVADAGRADLPVVGPSPADPAEVAVSPRSQRMAGDSYWLLRLSGIRPRLAAPGNRSEFDGDATAWRLLRPVAEAFLERGPWSGEGDGRPPGAIRGGLLAPRVARLVRARHPGEWALCPGCEGAGRSGSDQGVCPACSGRGYEIVE